MLISARASQFPARVGLGDGSRIVSVAGSTAGAMVPLFVAGPVGAAIGAGVTAVAAVLSALGVGRGCGQSCIAASQNADEIERALKGNLAAFEVGQIDQQTALANFDQLWAALQQACGQVGGDAGRNCIADRQADACKWKNSAGECWNWFTGYRDPIAAAVAAPSMSLTSRVASMSPAELLLAGLVGLVVVEAVS